MKCPTCQKEFQAEELCALPFCSPRCKQIDLGRWLGERHSMPSERNPDEGEPPDGTCEND